MTRPSIITIGVYDGVHRGHQAIQATKMRFDLAECSLDKFWVIDTTNNAKCIIHTQLCDSGIQASPSESIHSH